MSKERNSSIELLRIFATIGVVILHYNAGGALENALNGSINWHYLKLSESIFICAVDLFVMISGYFLINTQKRKVSKIIELAFEVILINLVIYCIGLFKGNVLNVKDLITCFLPANYFLILYAALYMISPYINIVLNHLNKRQATRMLMMVLFIFSIWSFGIDFIGERGANLSSIGISGSDKGYTIVNFVLCYIVGSYIGKYKTNFYKYNLFLYILTLLAVWLVSLKDGVVWNYNNPLVILNAASLVMIFADIIFKNSLVNLLARSTFTCYLVHPYLLSFLNPIKYVTGSLYKLIVAQFISAVSIFLLSYIVYVAYIYIYINGCLSKIMTKIDNIDIYSFDNGDQ